MVFVLFNSRCYALTTLDLCKVLKGDIEENLACCIVVGHLKLFYSYGSVVNNTNSVLVKDQTELSHILKIWSSNIKYFLGNKSYTEEMGLAEGLYLCILIVQNTLHKLKSPGVLNFDINCVRSEVCHT